MAINKAITKKIFNRTIFTLPVVTELFKAALRIAHTVLEFQGIKNLSTRKPKRNQQHFTNYISDVNETHNLD